MFYARQWTNETLWKELVAKVENTYGLSGEPETVQPAVHAAVL
jgi:hypothetical protein